MLMRNKMLCGLSVAVIASMLAVPVYAESGKTNGGNGGVGNGMGTGHHDTSMHVRSIDRGNAMQSTRNHDVSIYGTGTGSQFWNVNANQSNTGVTDGASTYRSQSYNNYNTNGYRAAATTTVRKNSWGWLGWLGLLGLFGLRNRNPQRDR